MKVKETKLWKSPQKNNQETTQEALMSRKGMWYTGVSWTDRQLENAVVMDRRRPKIFIDLSQL